MSGRNVKVGLKCISTAVESCVLGVLGRGPRFGKFTQELRSVLPALQTPKVV
jgi:hypothetical protein